MNATPSWWHNSHHSIQSRRGRAGGLKAAANRRYAKLLELRENNNLWPPCPTCGRPTRNEYCAWCDASVATMP